MALSDFMDVPGEVKVEEAPVAPTEDLSSFMDLPEVKVEEPKAPVAPVEEKPSTSEAERFYRAKAFSPPFQGMLPGIWHPALSAEVGKRGFGPRPEGGWDEFGRPLDAKGEPYYIEGVDPAKPGNWLANTFKGLSTLASHPMEAVKGALDFFMAMPAMTVGLLGAAGRGTQEITRQIAFGDVNLEEIYNALSKGMQESFEFFEPGKQLITGKPTEESQLMTQVMMAPLSAPAALGQKVASYEGFKDYPNVRGAAKILGDTVGFITMGLAYRGLFGTKKAAELESIVKSADELRAKEQTVAGIPEDLARNIQQKVLDIQKQRLEARAAKFAKDLGDDALIVEEMGRLKEEVAKAKSRPIRSTGLRYRKVKEEVPTDELKPAPDRPLMPGETVEIGTPSLKEFVDEPKPPIIAYHGAGKEVFDKFSYNRVGTGTDYGFMGEGFYFFKDPKKVEGYVTRKKGHIIEAGISLKNPLTDREVVDDIAVEVWKEKPNRPPSEGAKEIKKRVQALGYDGVIDERSGEIVVYDRDSITVKSRKSLEGKDLQKEPIIEVKKKGKKAKPTPEEQQALADAKLITELEEHYGKSINEITDKEIEDYITKQEGPAVDWFGEGERVTDIDRAAGEVVPELEGETSTFMQSREKTDQMAKLYEERAKAVSENPDLYLNKLVNDVNRWYHGDENVDITAVRNSLSNLAAGALDRMSSGMEEYFISEYERITFKETASEAANWARKLDKSKGVQLNMMIPVENVPRVVAETLKNIFGGAKKVLTKDVYRNKELFDKTGFWLGRDRKWRYEIDDSKAHVDFNYLKRLGSVKLVDILDFPELYDDIPRIKDTRVVLNKNLSSLAKYSSIDNTIHLRSLHRGHFIHELQHAVNEWTGSEFKGSSPEYQSYLGKQELALRRYREVSRKIKNESLKNSINNHIKQLEKEAASNEYTKDWAKKLPELADILENAGETDAASAARFPLGNIPDAFSKYQKTPGEMEARLAERRMNMSKEQRAKTPPWDTLDEMLIHEGLGQQKPGEWLLSGEPVGTKLYSGIPLNEGTKAIVDLYKRAKKKGEEARGLKKFDPKAVAKVLREEGVRAVIDRSGNIRREFLEKLGDEGYSLVQLMTLTKGSSSMAANKLRQLTKEVYGGLSRDKQKLLNDLIFHSRIVDIAKYKTPKEFKELNKYTVEEAVVFLEAFKEMEGLTTKEAHELYHVREDGSIGGRVGAYFNWMKMALKDMKDAGLISESEYSDLSAHNYRRLKIVDIYDKKVPSLGKKGINVYDSGVEKLAKGRESTIFERDGRIMALEVFNRAYGRIMKNEANKNLLKLAERDPNNLFARVKNKESKIPSGWRTVFAYKDGERKAIHISPEMSKEWITNDPVMSYKASQLVRWLSLSPVTRTFATGINWGFAVANLPRDIFHIWYAARTFENGKWKPLYNSNAPIYAVQMGRDLATVFLDAALKKGRYEDYINQGGGMEFLVHQGRLLQRGRHLEGPLDGIYRVLGYLGETSEVMTRLAIRERALRKGKSAQEATFAARDYMDFGQGGWATKATDNAIPYLNAGIVGTRGMIRAFKDNPIRSTYKMAQFAGLVTGIYMASKHYAPKTTEDLKYDISSQNNLCIPLSDYTRFIDERGQEHGIYFKIPLDHGQRFFKKFFEASTDKWLGEEVDAEGTANALANLSPVGLSNAPPSISGVFGYWMNKDFWLNEDIWRKGEAFSYPKSAKEYSSRTPEMFIDLGNATGLSPERSKYFVDQIITRDNVFSQMLGAGYDAAFGDLPKEKKEQHWAMALSKYPVIKRFIGITNPYTKYAGKMNRAQEEAVFKQHVENLDFDIKVEGYLYGEKGEVTRDELYKEARSYGDKDTYNRLIDRWKYEEAIKDLPNKSFWRRMKGLRLEAKAKVFADRLQNATPEEEDQLWREYSTVSRAKGVISPEFRKEVMKEMSK